VRIRFGCGIDSRIYGTLQYRKRLQTYLEVLREFLSGSWQYWSNLRTPTNVPRFFFFIVCGFSRYEQLYNVIHKSVNHFKNSQQIDYATDRSNSYVDRERNSPSIFSISLMLNISTFGNTADIYALVNSKTQNDCSRLLNARFGTTVS
jgi:hypothetical protein